MSPIDAAGLSEIYCNFFSDFAAELKYKGSGRDPGDALLREWESPRCPVPIFLFQFKENPCGAWLA